MNHYLFIDIPEGLKSIAFCSFLKPRKLVVFIHGFNGSAQGTWGEFSDIVQKHKSFEDADIIFYGYNTLRTQAANMKVSLFDLLNKAAKPTEMPYPERELPEEFRYEKIYLVAHSLGAVVARLALLHAYGSKCDWVSTCRLALFAPAHFGSNIPDNFKECFEGSWKLLRGFTFTKCPILKDITAGSSLLEDLMKMSTEVISKGEGEFCKAIMVVWADIENVVISRHFLQDEMEQLIPKSSHVSVCKFTYFSPEPLERLVRVL